VPLISPLRPRRRAQGDVATPKSRILFAPVRRIHELGFKPQFNDKPVQRPRSRSAYVADPDGILIEFTERFGGGLD